MISDDVTGKIVIRMSGEHRATLEAYRAALGLRSLNAAVLALIERAADAPDTVRQRVGVADGVAERRLDPPRRPLAPQRDMDAPVKSEPFVSRLKGEWKAP